MSRKGTSKAAKSGDGKSAPREAVAAEEAPREAVAIDDAPSAPAAQTLPLFYKGPRPVNSSRHAKFGLVGKADLGFARSSNVIPINFSETAAAAKFYPIIFSGEPPHMPVVVCGLHAGENAFITGDNLWAEHAYVPAYIRRYPFLFMEIRDRDQFVLSIDEDSGLVLENGERPLFDSDGKQTEIVERALEFCKAFHQQHRATREFVAALAEREMLVDNTTEFRVGDERRIELTGYKVVDPARFEALDDATFLDWRKREWLPAIYYHRQSLSNWPNVIRVAAARAPQRGANGQV